MKIKNISFIILIFFNICMFSQNYQQVIKPDTSIWFIAHKQLFEDIIDTLYAKSTQNEYIEIWFKGEYSYNQFTYIGKARSSSDNSKIWFVQSEDFVPEGVKNEEVLIFDITLDKDDTFQFGEYTATVDTVFFVEGLKIIEFSEKQTGWDENVRFIESIGPNISLIWSSYFGILNPYIVCKYEENNLIYINQNDNFVDCQLNTTSFNNYNLNEKIIFLPNPINDFLHIRIDDTIKKYDEITLQMFDIKGNIVCNKIIKNKELQIDIMHLKSGVYVVKVKMNNNIITKRIIKL